jgi:chloramphenicol-sensitive protein RarD
VGSFTGISTSIRKPPPPLEVTAQRIVWTLPCAFLAAIVLGGLKSLKVSYKTLMLLVLSALLIGGNWLLYVWAVGQNRIVESSLGYFINPLINVALGVAFFDERLTKWQIAALSLATGFSFCGAGSGTIVCVLWFGA